MTDDAPQNKISSGSHLLHASATATNLLALAAIAVELFTERWLANALGVPVFLSIPLGIGTIVFCVLTLKSTTVKAWPFLVLTSLYWSAFFVGLYVT